MALARAAINYELVSPAPAGSTTEGRPRSNGERDGPATARRRDRSAVNAQRQHRGFTAAPSRSATRRRTIPTIVKVNGFFDVLGNAQALKIIGILTILVLYVTAVYGPIAAALVEFFPTRIRYTAMSLPYHIGNGWFGGLLPPTAFAMVAATGDIYSGLWYPVVFALMTFVIGLLSCRETKDRDITPTRRADALSRHPAADDRSPAPRARGSFVSSEPAGFRRARIGLI